MTRLNILNKDQMAPNQKRIHDEIVAGPRGGIVGPFNALLHSPGIAAPAQEMGAYLRFESPIPAKLREFAILITARFWGAQFEWHFHAELATKEGLSEETIQAIAVRDRPSRMDSTESIIYEFCVELLERKEVSDASYAKALELLNEQGVVELVGIVGYYGMVSLVLNAFRVPAPDNAMPLS